SILHICHLFHFDVLSSLAQCDSSFPHAACRSPPLMQVCVSSCALLTASDNLDVEQDRNVEHLRRMMGC
ncbi:hypothetical protein JMJ77_0015423, partial [Colletotrichum scovillei]